MGFRMRRPHVLLLLPLLVMVVAADRPRAAESVAAGSWNPDLLRDEPVALEWDVSRSVVPGEPLFVTFRFDGGWKALEIEWAALVEDGREIARDAHRGWSGAESRQNVYALAAPASKKRGARYTVRALVNGAGGTDSTGSVMVSRTRPPPAPRTPGHPEFAPSDLPGARWYDHYPKGSMLAADRAFSEGLYDDAVRLYREADAGGPQGELRHDIGAWVEKRKALGELTPEAVQQVCVVFVTERRIKGVDGKITVKRDVTPEMKARWQLHDFGLVQRLVETYSNGKWSMRFSIADAIAEQDSSDRLTYLERDLIDGGDHYFTDVDRCDTFAVGSTTASPGLGGLGSYPYLRGVFYGPVRGSIQFNAENHDGGVLFHELFHTIEQIAPTGTPSHAFHPDKRHQVPAWKGTGEFDYYRWHYETTLPKLGWKNLAATQRTVALPGRDVEALRRVRALYDSIPVAERAARVTRARALLGQAHGKKKDAEAIPLLEQALAASPADPDVLARLLECAAPDHPERAAWATRLTDVQRVTGTFPAPEPSMALAGVWTPDRLRREPTILEWDVTRFVKPGEPLEITFRFARGRNALSIEWAELVEAGGAVLVREAHAGFSGNPRNEATTYTLAVPAAKKDGATYVVRARVQGSGGTDSTGTVVVRRRDR